MSSSNQKFESYQKEKSGLVEQNGNLSCSTSDVTKIFTLKKKPPYSPSNTEMEKKLENEN